jgi:hypothetical protein
MSLSEEQESAETWLSRTVTSGQWLSPFIPSGREGYFGNPSTQYVRASNMLRMALLFSKTFRTFTEAHLTPSAPPLMSANFPRNFLFSVTRVLLPIRSVNFVSPLHRTISRKQCQCRAYLPHLTK